LIELKNPIIDRVTIIIEDVDDLKFELLKIHLSLSKVNFSQKWISCKINDYYQNFTFGNGEGSVYVGWRHNSYRRNRELANKLKIEFNPSKCHPEYNIFNIFRNLFNNNPKKITMLDIAWDLAVYKDSIIVKTKTGREEHRIKGSRYWGTQGSNGRLKIYDKKKEREKVGVRIDQTFLTRIEYTWKMSKGVNIESLEAISIKPSQFYDLYLVNFKQNNEKQLNKQKQAKILSMVYAIQQGLFQYKDFSRRDQEHIKNALDSYIRLKLDQSIQESMEEIKNRISCFICNYSNIPYLKSTHNL
jgi:hypothetical protein